MGLSNEQVKFLFNKYEPRIKKHNLLKFISAISIIILCTIITFLPVFNIGNSFIETCAKHDIEITSSDSSNLMELFKQQEESYKKLNDIIGDYSSSIPGITDEDLAFSPTNTTFWLNVENIIKKSLNSSLRSDLIDAYKNSSTKYSFFNFLSLDFNKLLENKGIDMNGGPDVSLIMKLYFSMSFIFPIALIILQLKEFFTFFSKDYRKNFSYFESLLYGNKENISRYLKKQNTLTYLIGYIVFVIIDLVFLIFLFDVKISLSWLISIPIIFLLAYFIYASRVNKTKKELEYDITTDKYKDIKITNFEKNETKVEETPKIISNETTISYSDVDKNIENQNEQQTKLEIENLENKLFDCSQNITNKVEILFCKFCGNKISSDSLFCSHCGKKID